MTDSNINYDQNCNFGSHISTSEIAAFTFETREVRTLLIDDQPWFVVKDIIVSLEYTKSSNPAKLIKRVPSEWKGVNPIHTPGGTQKLLMLSEQGLYFFLGRSDKPKALPFQMWLAGDVLPAIRKHGHYHDTEGRMSTLIGQTIGTDGFHCLAAVVDGRLRHYPKGIQQRARSHLWSQVRKAFGVSRGEDIPASQLNAARQFIAAYALEGEWLPASPCTTVDAPPLLPDTPDEADYVNLKSLCHHMLQIRDIYRHYHLYDALTQLGSPAGKRLYGHVVDGAAIAQRYQPKLQQRLH